jgi:hypothetical protein
MLLVDDANLMLTASDSHYRAEQSQQCLYYETDRSCDTCSTRATEDSFPRGRLEQKVRLIFTMKEPSP